MKSFETEDRNHLHNKKENQGILELLNLGDRCEDQEEWPEPCKNEYAIFINLANADFQTRMDHIDSQYFCKHCVKHSYQQLFKEHTTPAITQYHQFQRAAVPNDSKTGKTKEAKHRQPMQNLFLLFISTKLAFAKDMLVEVTGGGDPKQKKAGEPTTRGWLNALVNENWLCRRKIGFKDDKDYYWLHPDRRDALVSQW